VERKGTGQMSHVDVEKWRATAHSLRWRDGRKRPSPHKRFKKRELWITLDGGIDGRDPSPSSRARSRQTR